MRRMQTPKEETCTADSSSDTEILEPLEALKTVTLWNFILNELRNYWPPHNIYQRDSEMHFLLKERQKLLLFQQREVDAVKKNKEEGNNRNYNEDIQSIPKNHLKQLLQLPLHLEKLMLFGMLICLDVLLYELTFMPLQALLCCALLICKTLCKSTFWYGILDFFYFLFNSAFQFLTKIRSSIMMLSVKYSSLECSEPPLQSLNSDERTMTHTHELMAKTSMRKRRRGKTRPKLLHPTMKNSDKLGWLQPPESSGGGDESTNQTCTFTASSEYPPFSFKKRSHPHTHKLDSLTEPLRLNASVLCDFTRSAVLLLSISIFVMVDISRVYHYIRAQPFIKLYVLFNMLEIFERLCRSLGIDIIDSILQRIVSLSNNNSTDMAEQPWLWGKQDAKDLPPHGIEPHVERWKESVRTATSEDGKKDSAATQSTLQFLKSYGITLLQVFTVVAYVLVHSFMHLLRTVSLNVAINSSESIMFLIAVTNNFAELKSTVFKKYTETTLYHIVASDIVERFQFICDAFIIFLRISTASRSQPSLMYTTLSWLACVLLLEVLVDWVKHGFILKFNLIGASAIESYQRTLLADVALSRLPDSANQLKASGFNVPCKATYSFSHISSRRIGFMALPVTTLIICGLPNVQWSSPLVLFCAFLIWLCLFVLKLLTSLLLLSFAVKRKEQIKQLNESFNHIRPL